jgi:hypothetical protein
MWIGPDVAFDDDDDLQFDSTVDLREPQSVSSALSTPIAHLRATFHLWLPLLLLFVLLLPHLTFLLPDTVDRTDEVYQPLRTLKFFKTAGREFHKYGPMPNFILAAPFGVTLGYWYLTGQISHPKDSFPYGLHDPMRQLGTLIFEGRVTMVLLGLIAFYVLAREIAQMTKRHIAVFLAMIFCIAGNAVVVWKLPVPEVDSPMLAFLALSLAVYLRILRRGITTKRLLWMFVFAVASISSKEIAGPAFVLPTMALLWMGWRSTRDDPQRRRHFLRCCAISISVGVGAYLLLNVIYAPHVWAERMHHWLRGEGVDSDVWGKSEGWRRVFAVATALLVNLGPGGVIAIVLAIIAAFWLKPRNALLLVLPAIGLLMVICQIRYAPSRFYTPVIVSLTPFMALALDKLLERYRTQHWLTACLVLLAGCNVWFATVTWLKMSHNSYYLAEHYADENVPSGTKIAMLSTWEMPEGSSRLEGHGHELETRPVQNWTRGAPMPQIVFVTKNKYKYLLEAKTMTARGSMLERESGFNANHWGGLDSMGYAEATRVKWELPAWYPFGFLPLGDLAEPDLLVFEHTAANPAQSTASLAR